MALQYLIDGYNVLKQMPELTGKSLRSGRDGLIRFIRTKKPQGKNEVIIVFDGKSDIHNPQEAIADINPVRYTSLKNSKAKLSNRVNRKGFGELIDFFAGQEDLRHKRIRILHDLSFVEDPTRIFRAIRFEQRYNFKIDKHTQDLIKKAVGLKMFERVQKQRIREELILLLSEKEPIKVIKRMAQLHQLSFIHPKIKLNKALIDLLQRIEERLIWFNSYLPQKRSLDKWLIYLIALFDQLNYKETLETCHKFVFNKGDIKRILSYKRASPRILRVLSKRNPLKPSHIFKLLEPMSYEVILLSLAKSKTKITEERISDFFTKYNGMRLNITGRDLKRIGLESGPQFKEILNKALYEKIDGKVKTKEDELEFVRRLVGAKTQKSKETSNY